MRLSRLMTNAILGFLVASLAALSVPAMAQDRSAVRHDFAMPSDGSARILLFRPSITVGAQSTGGLFEPNAEWTNEARTYLADALRQQQGSLGNRVIVMDEPVGASAQLVADYQALFSAVAQSVITYQFFVGNRLETKKRDNRDNVFDWTLGPGVAQLPGADQADYGLFIFTEDHYGSTGRKVLQVFAALGGVGVQVGRHAGYAALVDMRTGNIVWIRADNEMGGDVRTADGAQRRMGQLLEDFPGRAPVAATAAAAR